MNESTLADIITAKAHFEANAPIGSLVYKRPLKTLKTVSATVEKRALGCKALRLFPPKSRSGSR